MPSLIVPFRGAGGKSRLRPLAPHARRALAEAMLVDVVEACTQLGPTYVVGAVDVALPGVQLVVDPAGGQGAAVRGGLAAAERDDGPFLVINADLPAVRVDDLRAFAALVPDRGVVFVAAHDGTTNALGLSETSRFRPVYGAGSAARFAALEGAQLAHSPNLADDVDTLADLYRLRDRLGARSAAVLRQLEREAAVAV